MGMGKRMEVKASYLSQPSKCRYKSLRFVIVTVVLVFISLKQETLHNERLDSLIKPVTIFKYFQLRTSVKYTTCLR